jgi:hypothetical protein
VRAREHGIRCSQHAPPKQERLCVRTTSSVPDGSASGTERTTWSGPPITTETGFRTLTSPVTYAQAVAPIFVVQPDLSKSAYPTTAPARTWSWSEPAETVVSSSNSAPSLGRNTSVKIFAGDMPVEYRLIATPGRPARSMTPPALVRPGRRDRKASTLPAGGLASSGRAAPQRRRPTQSQCSSRSASGTWRTTRAGTPITTVRGSTSRVTTAPAAT